MGAKYYHYTNKRGANGIKSAKEISPSTGKNIGFGKDIAFGKGVYLTTLPPSSSDEDLLGNNYDNNMRAEHVEFVEYYIEVEFTAEGERKLDHKDQRRNVHVFRGTLKLNDKAIVKKYTIKKRNK